MCKILDGIASFYEEQGLICKIIGLSRSSFEKNGLIAIILKMKGLTTRALGSSPVDRETARSKMDHYRVGAACSPEQRAQGALMTGSPLRDVEEGEL
jgi:hypothetical protein